MKMKRTLLVTLLTVGLVGSAIAQDISPYLFGQNHWLAQGDEDRVGYIHLLWPKVKESGVKVVRIGGNGYNRNLPERQRLVAMVDSIRHIGAEPLLQVPCDYTVLQAMELVEYFTQRGEKKVQFWCIGNEPLLRNEFTIEGVRDYIMRIAPAMKRVDPTIKIFVFDECELREAAYRDLCGGRLDITGLKENGARLIDGFSFHKYPNGREFNRDNVIFSGPETIRNQAEKLVQMMNEADTKHRRTGDAKLMWALTEVNVTYANPDREIAGFGNTSFLGGQFMAEIFGIGMQYGAFTVNPWCISETDAVSTDFGYLGLPREFYPRSSYYHMQMMAEHMSGQFMPTSVNQDYVKAIGTKSDDTICVLVMNQSLTENFDFDIILNKNEKSTQRLTINADASLDKHLRGAIDNQTTVLFVFNAQGELLKQLTYGLKQNLKFQGPEVNNAMEENALMENKDKNSGKEILKRDGIIPPRDHQAPPNLIDLTEYYTASLDDDWLVSVGANLQPLPKGIQTWAGAKFDVRGLIQLAGKNLYEQSELDDARKKEYYPQVVNNIRVQLKGQKIHFVHASSWWADENDKVGEYVVHYENGEIRRIPLLYMQSLKDWWTTPNDPTPQNAEIAWQGQNE
ncbi:MAG: hypothetical protein EHM72_19575, partial [Calditrichaeota bacterium]